MIIVSCPQAKRKCFFWTIWCTRTVLYSMFASMTCCVRDYYLINLRGKSLITLLAGNWSPCNFSFWKSIVSRQYVTIQLLYRWKWIRSLKLLFSSNLICECNNDHHHRHDIEVGKWFVNENWSINIFFCLSYCITLE